MTEETITKAAELRAEAAEHERSREASFERCDTDGFLSQWASGLSAQKARAQADIEEAGGFHRFLALFDLEGALVPAQLVEGRFGMCWALHDEDGQFTGEFVTALPKRESTLTRKGYREGHVEMPAYAAIVGRGRGLSGSAWVQVLPGGHPSPWMSFKQREIEFPTIDTFE